MNFIRGLTILAALSFLAIPMPALGLEKRCEILRDSLEQKSLRLGQYLNAASKFDSRDDSEIVKALGSKISDLKEEILKMEKELAACKGEKSAANPEGLSTVKSEDSEYATKSCSELNKRLVALVKTVHSFRRRENSLLSELSLQEKKEFRDASEELKAVRDALRSRCSTPTSPRPFRREAKPSSRN